MAVVALAELLVDERALGGGAWPSWPGSRRRRPCAGWPPGPGWPAAGAEDDGVVPGRSTTTTTSWTALLGQVRDDEAARQEFVDILEVMGPDDPRTAHYRRQLTSRLF